MSENRRHKNSVSKELVRKIKYVILEMISFFADTIMWIVCSVMGLRMSFLNTLCEQSTVLR